MSAIDLGPIESRRQVALATVDLGVRLSGNQVMRQSLLLEMAKAAARSSADVPALIDEIRRLRATTTDEGITS